MAVGLPDGGSGSLFSVRGDGELVLRRGFERLLREGVGWDFWKSKTPGIGHATALGCEGSSLEQGGTLNGRIPN